MIVILGIFEIFQRCSLITGFSCASFRTCICSAELHPKQTTAVSTQTNKEDGDEEENDDVLDFSSGSAKVVKDTATKVKVVSEKETKNAGGKAFSQFRYVDHCPRHRIPFNKSK